MSFNTVLASFISPSPHEKRLHDDIHEKVALLDGGFGTTLEHVFKKDVSHPLWSARFVDEEEDAIVMAHLAFLEAGSQVLLTSTYQEAYETFWRAGYSDLDAERLMIKSVDLAARAIEIHMNVPSVVSQEIRHRPRIALSLGPYGSTLEVAAEFTGIYPPPYGPPPVDASSLTAAGPFLFTEELSHIDALAAFHFSRLLVYARNPAVWDKIDIVAFETVPLLTEAKAIRVAVARLMDWFAEITPKQDHADVSMKMKPWYISFVFAGSKGEFPQRCQLRPGESVSRPLAPYEIAKSVFTKSEDIRGRRMALPDGIGVNCTPIHCIREIVRGFADAIRSVRVDGPDIAMPWLVLCPNGGLEYDTVNKVWIKEEGTNHNRKDWTDSYTMLVRDIPPSRFGGLLLGGCCNTTPDDMKALARCTASTMTEC